MITLEDAERNLDDLRKLGVRIIDFTGGEPLLHPKLDSLLSMAKERGFLTTVTSNGLLYPKRARSLAGKVDLLHFSIDSPDAGEHNRSRGVRCFDKLLESVQVAISLGETPDLLMTVTNDNYRHIGRVYDELALPNRLVLILNPLFEYNSLGDELSAEVMSLMREYGRRRFTYLNPAFLTLRQRGGNNPSRPDCRAVSTTVVISPFNELVLPCYHYGLERIPIDGKLHGLWRSDTVEQHRRMEGRHTVCAGCTINCYFEPSFGRSPGSRYFWESLPSKMGYGWTKFVLQRMRSRFGPTEAVMPQWPREETSAACSGDGMRTAEPIPILTDGDAAPASRR
jgi:MoaA/NifB/PqqE/SkfB family radical SAM enzyme